MDSIGLGTKWYISSHVPVILFAAFWLVSDPAYAAESPALHPNSLAEQWVIEQVTADKIADLKERFPEEADRVLSAVFLVKLLTDSPKDMQIHRHGIRIRHAILTEPIDLVNGEILHETWLDDCRFESGVNFGSSHFHRSLSFDGSTFSAEQTANFNSMKVDGSVFFRKAVFAGPVNFRHATVAPNFEADEAQFTSAEQTANFNSMKVDGYVFFRKAVFAGPVNFRLATVTRNFEADEAQFTNAEQTADFSSMQVDGSVVFRKAVFAGPVNFGLRQSRVTLRLTKYGLPILSKQPTSMVCRWDFSPSSPRRSLPAQSYLVMRQSRVTLRLTKRSLPVLSRQPTSVA